MELINRHINNLDKLIDGMLRRNMNCMAHIERRDALEEFRAEFSRFTQMLPYHKKLL